MADEPIELLGGEGTALVRRSAFGVLLGIMPWNFPYYQVARFAGPNHVIGNTILLKHAPQCPESAEAIAQIFEEAGFPDGHLREHLRDQRADRVGDRRPARARRLGHRLRARRAPRSPRSPGATSRRSCSSSAARTRSSCSAPTTSRGGRGAGRRSTPRQRRPVVQRGQALHRPRQPLRRVPGEVQAAAGRCEAERPDLRGDRDGAALVQDRRGPARRPGQTRRPGRRGGPDRRQAERQLLRAHDPHRASSPATTPPRKSSSARSHRSTRSPPRRRRSSSRTTRSSGSAPT